MATKYIYKEKEFKTLYAVRQYIGIEERIGFGEAETVEDFRRFGFDVISIEYDPEQEYYASLTKEQKTVYNLDKTKNERAEAVAAIKVMVDGMVFDGDETAQSRMARALTAAEAAGQTSTVWVLADNTIATVTKAQLAQALALSMQEMGKLWTVPYKEKAA
ncbi:DUF4376 domain-containing protein [Sutterella wadsworthensis]|jgi:hypothetical protein|uniref:DUF4376 domain-containing protein n=1 Tax=Sutterella wadsworthensis TaxID=40545 RepID=UPI0035640C93